MTKVIAERYGFFKSQTDYYNQEEDNDEYCIKAHRNEQDFTELKKEIVSNANLARRIEELGFKTMMYLGQSDIDNKVWNQEKVRAAAANIIPSSTGAAKAIGLVLPQLKGKLDGTALRVPTITGSIVDLTVELKKMVTFDEVDKAFKNAANESMKYSIDPIVSSDVIGSKFGAVYDAHTTQIMTVDGKQLVKVMAWYDNEMSYTAQLVRTIQKLASLIK